MKPKTPKSLGWNSGLISETLSGKSNVLPRLRSLGERDIQDRTAKQRKEELILPRTGHDQGQWKERELMLKGK